MLVCHRVCDSSGSECKEELVEGHGSQELNVGKYFRERFPNGYLCVRQRVGDRVSSDRESVEDYMSQS